MSTAFGEGQGMPLSEEDGAQNGNVLFDIDPSENVPVKEGRVIKKAKRPSKLVNVNHEASPDGVSPPPVNGTKALLVNSKNSRRPRNLKGRGLPKKGGLNLMLTACVVFPEILLLNIFSHLKHYS